MSVETVPRLALTREQAADALGVSLDTFERHVQHEIRVVRRGRRILIPTRELERWLDANAERVLDPGPSEIRTKGAAA
jgi:excisionase family DNA binding protein